MPIKGRAYSLPQQPERIRCGGLGWLWGVLQICFCCVSKDERKLKGKDMRRVALLSAFLAFVPVGMMAQDDLYFIPSKDAVKVESSVSADDGSASYGGISMSDDEYNRRHKLGSYYQKIGQDSLGNDIIQFHSIDGVGQIDTIYPGSERYVFDDDDDFTYSRRMGRFDNFYGWYDPYYASYWYDPWFADNLYWRWGSSWYYDSLWGWPYYSAWNWHYRWPGSYWGWYHPISWGWYHPHYAWHGHTGTNNHSYARVNSSLPNGGGRYGAFGNGVRRNTTGTIQKNSYGSQSGSQNRSFRGSSTYTPNRNDRGTRTYKPERSVNRGSSFGGNRSFNSGSRSFGGGSRGSFGGGGSRGGFGGRR